MRNIHNQNNRNIIKTVLSQIKHLSVPIFHLWQMTRERIRIRKLYRRYLPITDSQLSATWGSRAFSAKGDIVVCKTPIYFCSISLWITFASTQAFAIFCGNEFHSMYCVKKYLLFFLSYHLIYLIIPKFYSMRNSEKLFLVNFLCATPDCIDLFIASSLLLNSFVYGRCSFDHPCCPCLCVLHIIFWRGNTTMYIIQDAGALQVWTVAQCFLFLVLNSVHCSLLFS